MKKNITLLGLFLFLATFTQAQNVGVGTNAPAASAKLDITSTNSGVLIPRVALTMTTAAGPVAAPANSLLVYNTATAADVTPGFYYWSSTTSTWIRLAEGSGWLTTGNNGIGAANFLGPINAADLNFRTNNTQRAVITSAGNMGVGDATPAALFTVGAGDLFQVQSTGHAQGIFATAGSPSFSFVGDTDNGMYRSAADELSFSTAGTQRTVITSAGIVGINVAAPNASAQLDITATNKGVLIPRVALTATNAAGPVPAPATSLLVYNTATAGAGTAIAVTPGFYYWDGAAWVRVTENGWKVGTSTATTNAIGAAGSIGYLGTSTNSHVDLVSNNIVRGRLSNLGEFFIGTTNTVLAGDLMNGVGNVTFPWAVNGYTNFNGGGVYGALQGANTTSFAAVQGENNSTSGGINTAAVRGINTSAIAGTGFRTLAATGPRMGVNGNVPVVGTYSFGVFGSSASTSVRTGAVFGDDGGFAMGSLGYYAFSGADYSVYGFGIAAFTGIATGKPTVNNPTIGHVRSTQTLEPNNHIGLGIYGGVMGGWIRGLKYGFNMKGETYSMYVDGKSYTTQPLAYLMPTATDERIPGYMASTMNAEISCKGKTTMEKGNIYVAFDDKFKKVMTNNAADLIIVVTPHGNTQGVYVHQITTDGFWISENNSGQSTVQISWVATSPATGADTQVDSELLNYQFDVKMNGVMYNDYNTTGTAQPMWWDGSQMRWDVPMTKQPDTNSVTNAREEKK